MEQLIDGLSSEVASDDIEVLGIRSRPKRLVIDLVVRPDRRLFAKLALPEDQATPPAERPRLVPVAGHGLRLRWEAAALNRLAAAVPADDPDLAVVRVVHRQESPAALVVEWVDGQALSSPLGPLSRDGDAGELLRKAGRWLELFHGLAVDEPLAYRYPEDVVKWLAEVEGHLAAPPRRWSALIEALAGAIEDHADLRPQVGLHHGDMAARNLMVRPDGRLVGVDAGVVWQAPRSHDLAVFLVDLHLRSPRRVRERVPDFVGGYGYSPVTGWTSLVFLGVALVDRYLARLVRVEGGQGATLRRSIEGVRLDRLADDLRQCLEEGPR